MSERHASWYEENQRGIVAEVARVRALLEGRAEGADGVSTEAYAAPALDALCRSFALSPFERDLLVMCAAMELDGSFAYACAVAQGDPARAYPTFGLALAALPDAHWSALAPSSPLRAWRLVEVASGQLLTTAWLRIDEAALHYLAGTFSVDERLEPILEAVASPGELPPSQESVAARLAELWSQRRERAAPLVHLGGRDVTGRRAVAAAAAERHGLALYAVRAADLPATAAERDELARVWMRQALLGGNALLVEIEDADTPETERLALGFVERTTSPAVLAGREAPRASRALVRLEVATPTPHEQEELWQRTLGAGLNGAVERVVAQFDLARHEIEAAGVEARARQGDGAAADEALWDASRAQARPRLDDLAQRIDATAAWEDLVVPETERRTLRELVLHVRHRLLVQERWGFAEKSRRGLGVSALFAGPSGTGKTMAAEVLAGELRLDLYRIDLSAVVSKYIGETEKNLRRVFDAAEHGGAILLFDEADALFGKRSEVKDSHDRYANIEVGYLLQRMEAYRGLAILTTNMKSALDAAFLRRIRFVVQFTRPDLAARREIWRRVFPERTPTHGLEVDALARLDVTGGAIRNIALRAAFLAADAGSSVGMAQLADAARSECAKLERPVAEAEIGGWA